MEKNPVTHGIDARNSAMAALSYPGFPPKNLLPRSNVGNHGFYLDISLHNHSNTTICKSVSILRIGCVIAKQSSSTQRGYRRSNTSKNDTLWKDILHAKKQFIQVILKGWRRNEHKCWRTDIVCLFLDIKTS